MLTHPSPSAARPRRAPAAIAVLLLLLAALLRLAAFQEALVGADQSSILAAAADIAAGRDLPIVGMKSSVGVMQTPVVGYLAALPFALLPRVISIRWFFSALDLLALTLAYRAVSRTLGRTAGLVALLLLATNPWLVEFNRWIWYQTLIPTFATFAFAALVLLVGRPKNASPALIPLAMVSATLMGLVHLASLPWAALLILVALTLAWKRRHAIAAIAGIAGCLIVSTPYALFLVRTRFADVRTILSNSSGPAGWNTSTYRLTLELLTGHQVLQTPRDPLWARSVLRLDALMVALLGLLALALLATLLEIARSDRSPRRDTLLLVLAWSLLAPTLFVRSSFHLQHFYLLFVFPAPFVLLGSALDRAFRNGRLGRVAGTLALGLILLLTAWWSHLWLVRIGFEQQGRLRAPTRAWLMDAAADTVAGLLEADPDLEVIILTRFDSSGLSPFDWIRNALHSDRIRTVPVADGLIVPARATCYLVGPEPSADALAPIADRLRARPELALPASPPWPIYCTAARPTLPAPLATWENGLSLVASEHAGEFAPGGRLTLVHTWHYEARQRQEYHLFNHLLRDGELVAQIDGAGVPTRFWRDDDVLVTRFVLDLPAELTSGSYRLAAGTYTWPGIVRIPRTDGSDSYELARWER